MLAALLPLIKAMIDGASFAAAVGSLTLDQQVAIGVAVLKAAPEEIALIRGLSALFEDLVSRVLADADAASAAAVISKWLAANGDKAIELQPGAGANA